MRDVLVLGSGRSGTSMLAGTLHASGWWVGDRPYPGRASNPKGFFETPEVNGINEALLAGVLAPAEELGPWQRWLSLPGRDVEQAPSHLAARIARLAARSPFCFKDPRFSATLPAWRAHLGAARFLCIFREPAATADSILRECGEAEYLADVPMDRHRALELWRWSYRRILDRHRLEGDWLFLHYDQVASGSGLDRLEAFLDAPVDRLFAERGIGRSRPSGEVTPALSATYEELCELAGHRGGPGTVAGAAAPATLAPPAGRAGGQGSPPELSVVLCTYDRVARLLGCLEALAAQSAPVGSFEVVLVDDGSHDGTSATVADLALPFPLRLIRRENGGLAAARNTGIAEARGRVLLFLDDDVEAAPDLVQQHLDAHRRLGGRAASVLGTLEPPLGTARALDQHVAASDEVFPYSSMVDGGTYDWTRFWTGNISVPAAAVRQVGGFDESFRRYGCEDTDLGVRLQRAGVPVLYAASARARHHHAMDLDELAQRQRTVAAAFVRLFAVHPDALQHPDWRWVADLDLATCDREVVDRLAELASWEAEARRLADVRLPALAGLPGHPDRRALEALAIAIRACSRLWWLDGFAEGLREHGATSFAELAGRRPVRLATRGTAWLALPAWDDTATWAPAIGRFVDRYGAGDDVTLVVRGAPDDGWGAERVLATLARVLADRDDATLPDVMIVDDELAGRPVAVLMAAVSGYLPTGEPDEDAHRAVAEAAGRATLDLTP